MAIQRGQPDPRVAAIKLQYRMDCVTVSVSCLKVEYFVSLLIYVIDPDYFIHWFVAQSATM